MSTEAQARNCQTIVSELRSSLDFYYTGIAARLHETGGTAMLPRLSMQQYALYAATFVQSQLPKVVVWEETKDLDSLLSSFTGWCELFDIPHSWQAVSSPLSEQEKQGIIHTSLSTAYHRLLLNTQPDEHILITPEALAIPPPSLQEYAAASIVLAAGQRVTMKELLEKLVAAGYQRHTKTLEPGTIRVRGESIDSMHPALPGYHTLTFFGNAVERIVFQRGQRSNIVSSVTLPPVQFPDSAGSWQEILEPRLTISPSTLVDPKGAHVVCNGSSTIPAFPVQDGPSPEAASLFLLYENYDRMMPIVQNYTEREAVLCPAALARQPIALHGQDWELRTETSFFPPASNASGSPISLERARELIGELTPGKPAVHADHGIGMYEGLEQRNIEGFEREYLTLRYAEGDSLAVPVEYAHKVTPYIGEKTPVIHRLGGTLWQQTRKKAQEDAAELARELLMISSKRHKAVRSRYFIDPAAENMLEESFPYELTPDQQQTLNEVLADMQSPQPMDRLIVGDVGFGKTEIAARAAYHAVQSNRQVAVLAPTTLLVQQHYDTFKKRLPGLTSSIKMLSRFSDQKTRRQTKQTIEDGSAHIVIGTHAILNKTIQWKNLGLVVIDEEQRFGVTHKEHFKKMRSVVDILSLSATPIPRTLSMALSGLRSLSIITTAPAGRRDIKTFVKQANDDLLRAIIAREQKRSGQVYVVAPKIRHLASIAEHLKTLAPTASIEIAHGALPDAALSSIIHRFDSGQTDILVSSSIVENGLDLPNVNTMIVWHAPHFGLAQLYQLRGRIGRSDRQGYAYFLYNQTRLTPDQRERLAAITEASRLGSGWEIARRDLEMRGAGNLLGASQSGSAASVGVQLYLDMVERAAGQNEDSAEAKDPDIELPIPAVLPPHYIQDSRERTRWYQRLTRTRDSQRLLERTQELESLYGAKPPEVEGLIQLLTLRQEAARAGITSITSKTISPSDEDPYERLEVTAAQPRQVLEKVGALGNWQVRQNVLFWDVDAISPRLVQSLIDALD